MKSLKERFEDKFEKANGCWEWKASKNERGYGIFCLSGKKRLAHRMSWTLYVGEIPVSMQVLHHCDNPSCVNPSHLFLGTNLDNVKDCMSKGRNICGEKSGRSKLTAEQVKQIREMRKNGATSVKLAKEFGVSQSHICSIAHYRYWKEGRYA